MSALFCFVTEHFLTFLVLGGRTSCLRQTENYVTIHSLKCCKHIFRCQQILLTKLNSSQHNQTRYLIRFYSKDLIRSCIAFFIQGWGKFLCPEFEPNMTIDYRDVIGFPPTLKCSRESVDYNFFYHLLAQFLTKGCETSEMTLRRNGLGQLGFHVNYEGIVAEVFFFK